MQYPGPGKGLQKEETKFLKLVIDYIGPVIDYNPLCMPWTKIFHFRNRLSLMVINYRIWARANRLLGVVIDYRGTIYSRDASLSLILAIFTLSTPKLSPFSLKLLPLHSLTQSFKYFHQIAPFPLT